MRVNDPTTIQPAIIIVIGLAATGHESLDAAKRHFFDVLERVHLIDVSVYFNSFQIIDLYCGGSMTEERGLLTLRDQVLRHCDYVRLRRKASGVLFSATHFNALFEISVSSPWCNEHTFSFIQASRSDNPPPSPLELTAHLSNFLRQIDTMTDLVEFVIPVVVSSLLLDSCSLRAHGKHPIVCLEV